MGVVPPTRLGRLYRDMLGRVNQRLAQSADEVLLLVAGLAVEVEVRELRWSLANKYMIHGMRPVRISLAYPKLQFRNHFD